MIKTMLMSRKLKDAQMTERLSIGRKLVWSFYILQLILNKIYSSKIFRSISKYYNVLQNT